MKKKLLLFIVAATMIFATACSAAENKINDNTSDSASVSTEVAETDATLDAESNPDTEEEKYNLAIQYMNDGDWESAIELFVSLGTYQDSVMQKMACLYAKAQEDIDNEAYEDAMIALGSLGSYKDADALRKECKYKIAISDLDNGDSVTAYLSFCELGEYEDSADYALTASEGIEKELYDLGMEYYNNGLYQTALYCFSGANEYEDAAAYKANSQIMLDYEGVYKYSLTKGTQYYVIYGNTLSYFDFENESEGEATADIDTMILYEYEGQPALIDEMYADKLDYSGIAYYVLTVDDEGKKCIETINQFNKNDSEHPMYVESSAYTKEDLIARTQASQSMVAPAIGMTAKEVEESTWGKPEKINQTTYTWGTMEQWCYSDYRYVYLENGVVTAIQE